MIKMKQHNLSRIVQSKKKRLGRGYGTGKGGHTSSRGAKGQKARNKLRIWFEGGQLALIRKLPKAKGKGRFKPLKPSPVIINLKDLTSLKSGSQVNKEFLIKIGYLRQDEADKFGVKILGEGEIKVPLIVQLPTSKSARKKIEKAGGKVE